MIEIIKEAWGSQTSTQVGFFTKRLTQLLETPAPAYAKERRIIRPSQVCECMRYLVADMLNFPIEEHVEARHQRIFDNGTFVHKRVLQSYLPKLGITCNLYDVKRGKWMPFSEISIRNLEYWIKGAPDAVIFNPETGLSYIFELKSIKHELFTSLIAPDETYLAQVTLYMFMTGIPRAIIFYESKNTQEVKEFAVDLDPDRLAALLGRIKTIQGYVTGYPTTQLLPACENTSRYACRCTGIKV